MSPLLSTRVGLFYLFSLINSIVKVLLEFSEVLLLTKLYFLKNGIKIIKKKWVKERREKKVKKLIYFYLISRIIISFWHKNSKIKRNRMFSVFDTIVYPGCGVCQISQQITKNINNNSICFYELKFLYRDIVILVPMPSIMEHGIRKLATVKEFENLLKTKDLFCDTSMDEVLIISWNRRSKDYQNRIKKGELKELIVIYKELKTIETKKILSFGEKTILTQSENLIAEEYSVVFGKNLEDSRKELINFFENESVFYKEMSKFYKSI